MQSCVDVQYIVNDLIKLQYFLCCCYISAGFVDSSQGQYSPANYINSNQLLQSYTVSSDVIILVQLCARSRAYSCLGSWHESRICTRQFWSNYAGVAYCTGANFRIMIGHKDVLYILYMYSVLYSVYSVVSILY